MKKFEWVGICVGVKQIVWCVGEGRTVFPIIFDMNACTTLTQFSLQTPIQLRLHHLWSWLAVFSEFLLYIELLWNTTQSRNDLYHPNPILTSLKLKHFSDIYRACLTRNHRAASYQMFMICCKPPALRGSETGVSCTACILMKVHIVIICKWSWNWNSSSLSIYSAALLRDSFKEAGIGMQNVPGF